MFSGALTARENAMVQVDGATGGSAVPVFPETCGRSGYRQPENIRMAVEVKAARRNEGTKVKPGLSGPPCRWWRCLCVCRYGFASGACNTVLQAGGSAAIVIGGFGFGGTFGGLGWSTESLNQ
jgi:hypothetical protein